MSCLDKNILAYSTSFFASEPQQFADISNIVIQQFKESQELKNPVLFFFAHTLFYKCNLVFHVIEKTFIVQTDFSTVTH